ncbi:MAG: hypothetical protein AAGD11_01595 [Planctomycetota bacterium]
MLRWKSLLADALNNRRLPKGVRRKQSARTTLARRMQIESLEDRRMLAIDVFIDAVTGFVTIKDESGLAGGDTVQEDNQVTLAFANMDPDSGEGAGVQPGLLITDPEGVNAIGPEVFSVVGSGGTQAFVPVMYDAMPGVGEDLQNALTPIVVIDLQDNDDTLTLDDIDDATLSMVEAFDIRGGSNGGGSDVLVLNGVAGNQDDVEIQPSATVLGEQTVTGLGANQTVRGFEHIVFNGQDADDDDLTINLGLGEAVARVQHSVVANADEVISDRLPTIQFTEVNDFVLEGGQRTTVATFVMDVLNNNRLEGADTYRFLSNDQDTLVIESESDDDRITVSLDTNGDLQIFDTDVTINTTRMIPNDNLHIKTGGGDDTVTIDVGGTELISTPILYDGGNGTDILRTIGNPTPANVDVRYTPGQQPDEGRLAYDDNNGDADPNGNNDGLFADMRIDFTNLEPIEERTIADSLTVVGNGADNAISYTVGSNNNTNRGLVSIDGFETIEFQGKTNLIIDGGGGSDEISVNNPNRPVSLNSITINGGEPTAGSDRAIITNTDGGVLMNFAVTSDDDAVVTGAGPVPITLTTIESALIDGQGGAEALTYTSPAGVDILEFTPGPETAGAGTIEGETIVGGQLMPLSFTNVFGPNVSFADVDGIRTDALVVNGTDDVDAFSVDAAGQITVRDSSEQPTTPNFATPGVNQLSLLGLDGDDTFSVAGDHPFMPIAGGTDGLIIEGGNPDNGSDVLNLAGAAGIAEFVTIAPATGNPTNQTVTGLGAPIAVSGTELITYTGDFDDTLVVNPGAGADNVRIDEQVASAGAFTGTGRVTSGSLPTLNFTSLAAFVVDATVGGAVNTTFKTGLLDPFTVYQLASGSEDVLTIEGADTFADNFGVFNPIAGPAGGNVSVIDTIASVTVTNITPGPFAPGELRINTLAGDDIVAVDVGGLGASGFGGVDLIDTRIVFDGGTGADTLVVNGTPVTAVNNVVYTPGADPTSGRIDYGTVANAANLTGASLTGTMQIEFTGLEPVFDALPAANLIVNGSGADNQITYGPSNMANVGLVSVDGFEIMFFENKVALSLNGRAGDDVIVANNAATPTGLTTVNINAGDGADQVRLEALPAAVTANVNGNGGDDIIDASTLTGLTFLNGGAGDDTITGGMGVDTITGGSGDDTFVDSPGNDSYDGGAGNNTLLFRGTINNDVIDVTQTTPTAVTFNNSFVAANLTTETLTLGTIDQLRIEALDGDDIIRVAHADGFNSGTFPSAQAIRFEVQGNAPNASDRLVVQDLEMGDLVIHRVGADGRSGSVSVGVAGTSAPVDYAGIEFVDVTPLNNITGATGTDMMGQLVVFKNDPFEANNSLANATFLGSGSTLNVDPTIDPAGIPQFNIPGDSDFYRFVAQTTGTLDLQVYFEEIPTLNNGRPGLPNNGNLDIQLYDEAGNLIAGAGPNFGGNNNTGANPELNNDGDLAQENERIRVPVVAGETYFLRVFGNVNAANVSGINVYSITAINEAPPVPFDLELNDIIQVGTVNLNITPTTGQFRATLNPVNGVLPPVSNDFIGKTIEFTSGPNTGRTATITNFLSLTGQFTVGPGLVAPPAFNDTFIIESTDTGRSQLDDTTRDSTPIITFRLNDNILLNDVPGNPGSATPPDEVIPIPFNGSQAAALVAGAGFRVPVFIEGAPQQPGQPPLTPVGYAVQLLVGGAAVPGVYTFDFGTDAIGGAFTLSDGSHFVSAGIEIIDSAMAGQFGYGPRSESFEIVVDTANPLISFGDPTIATDGLIADSDTGVATDPATLSDRITSDTTPTFFGQAEANSIVKAYVDVDGNNAITAADIFIGQTVAIPLDGTNQEPFGRWEITSSVNMNDQLFTGFGIGPDGARTILVSAEDVAGNTTAAALPLTIFLDTQGPQITGVSVNLEAVPTAGGYDLFDPKPSVNGPSPLVNSITINFADLPARSDVLGGAANDFIYPALDPTIAGTIGNYSVTGDANGPIVITSATVNQAVRLSGTVTAAAAAGATTVTDAGLAAGTVVGDFIVFNNGAAGGLTRRITNVAGGVLTIDAALGLVQAVGDGFSIVPAASILNAGALIPNLAAQSTVTSTANTTTTFTVGNLPFPTGAAAGDYLYFNTGANAGQIRRVTATAGGGTTITVANAFTSIPSAGDTITLIDAFANFGTTALNTASVTLTFAEPLPDDRFTVTVSDNLVDPVGNKLDGESNATTPTATPTFPTGDGVPGGDFAGRFTIDARAEIGVWASGIAQIDINGNRMYDPENIDATNRDINFQIGFASDNIFAGRFGISDVTGFATGFDTLAAYGRVNGQWRWLVDRDHNGTIDDGDININEPFNGTGINGMPAAGEFNDNSLDGDEVAVFDGDNWYLDTTGNFQLDTIVPADYHGYPIIGDFDGDGNDDLGAYTPLTNQFGGNLVSIDTDMDGTADAQFRVGFGGGNADGFNLFVGVRERAVAADMDGDGYDDIGFWVPDGTTLNPGDQGEWYFFLSDGDDLLDRLEEEGDIDFLAYTPDPFGDDFSARFGNSYAVPIVGNFDPPVVASSGATTTQTLTPAETDPPTEENEVAVSETPAADETTTTDGTEALSTRVSEAPTVDTAVEDPVIESEEAPVADTTPEAAPEATPEVAPELDPAALPPATEPASVADEVLDVEETVVPDATAAQTDNTAADTEAPRSNPVVEQHTTPTNEPETTSAPPEPVEELLEVASEAPVLPPEPTNEIETETPTPTETAAEQTETIPEVAAEEIIVEEFLSDEGTSDEVAPAPEAVEQPSAEAPTVDSATSEPDAPKVLEESSTPPTEPPVVEQPGVPDVPPVVDNSPVEPVEEPVVEQQATVRSGSAANWWSSGRSTRRSVTTSAKPVVTQTQSTSPIPTTPATTTPAPTQPTASNGEVAATLADTAPAAPVTQTKTTTAPATSTASSQPNASTAPEVVVEEVAVDEVPTAQQVAPTPEPEAAGAAHDLQSMAFSTSTGGSIAPNDDDDSHWQQSPVSTDDLATYKADATDAALTPGSDAEDLEAIVVDRDAEPSSELSARRKAFAELADILFRF